MIEPEDRDEDQTDVALEESHFEGGDDQLDAASQAEGSIDGEDPHGRKLEGASLANEDDDPEFQSDLAFGDDEVLEADSDDDDEVLEADSDDDDEVLEADSDDDDELADVSSDEDDDDNSPRESGDLLLSRMRLESKVESILFASPKPMKLMDIAAILDDPKISPDDIQMVIDDLIEQYQNRQGGFFLNYIKRQGYQFRTTPSAGRLMERMFASRPRPLSRAAQETLAIIAYRQPVTRAEVEFIRGVDAGSIIKTLIEREMIKCVGRKEVAGRPMLFGTTDEFCKIFQIGTIRELPPLDAFQPENEQIRQALGKIEAHERETEIDLEDYVGDPDKPASDPLGDEITQEKTLQGATAGSSDEDFDDDLDGEELTANPSVSIPEPSVDESAEAALDNELPPPSPESDGTDLNHD